MFYLAYFILLRKETFFNSNRWFLLAGLITSVALPLVVFTKIVWVDSSQTNIDWSKIPVTTSVENEAFEINWYLVFAIVYSIGILVFLIKFAFDFYSLSKVLKGKTIQQQADFKFIDVKENVSPFSYFNYIVFNSSLYSDMELENILEHEKVHSAQNHTIDVLISRLFCVIFWYNPFVWLYKKAIVQNLEFIADSEATKNISDKKAYQFTLLKITTHENCVAITNHFYQSLIKKRIVMLNKNQSNKRNSWKYVAVLPLLVAFVFFLQVKVVAQEKKTQEQKTIKMEEIIKGFYVSKETNDETINSEIEIFKNKYKTDVVFSEIKRNTEGEIIALKVDITSPNKETNTYQCSSNEPINPFFVFLGKKKNSNEIVGFSVSSENTTNKKGSLYDSNGLYEIPPPPPPTTSRPTKQNKNPTSTSPILPPPPPKTPRPTKDIEKAIIIINGNRTEATLEDLNKLDQKLILSMNILKGKNAIEKYGKDGENGAIEISTKENVDPLKYSLPKAKNETNQDKSEIESDSQETVVSKEEWLKTYKVIWLARFNLEKMKIEKEQAKLYLEKPIVTF